MPANRNSLNGDTAQATAIYFDADVSLNKIELGEEILIQAIVRDVTIRKKWEQAMKESEERYRSLFDDSRDAIYITRKDGTFVDVNESFVNLFGFTRQEVLKLNAKMGLCHAGRSG